jgi:chemosensory pili system protein ChpA (sensor histidine kinase/response regulator)
MTQDKELEIRRQFLDEAQEYLQTLETAVLGLSGSTVDIEKINAALRAAHSIKGGAAMMGYETLSHLAHRLEDSFKVLKIQRHSITIDGSLESLLLTAVDCLNQVIQFDRQSHPIDPQWLDDEVVPVFEQLYDLLGEPQPEDANSILAPEEGQDVVRLLFESEVDSCLQRLETALAERDLRLKEEVEVLAQELGGLGEMLQLTAFTQVCRSVAQYLAEFPDHTIAIAESALSAWRRSQSLVLAGEFNSLPNHLEVPGLAVLPAPSLPDQAEMDWNAAQVDESVVDPLTTQASEWVDFLSQETDEDADVAAVAAPFGGAVAFDAGVFEAEDTIFTVATDDNLTAVEDGAEVEAAVVPPQQPVRQELKASKFRISGASSESVFSDFKEPPETTVRIPSKQLDQLNDMLGELTIERNALDLHLKRLNNLVVMLKDRVQLLDQSNAQLRDNYDKPTRALLPSAPAPSSPASIPDSTPSLTSASNGYSGLQERFDVLEMDRYSDLHLLSQEMMETIVQIQEVTNDIELSLDDSGQTARNINKTSRQLQVKLTKMRMRPLSDAVDRFPRALRELSLQHNKPVQLKVYGSNTLIDRNILETLSDPLMHLVRNAFDHGIEDPETRRKRGKPEEGLIEIRASHRNNRTVITIRDDGGGIPLDKVRARARAMGLDDMLLAAASDDDLLSLIFEPGFSTADQVTALSGRGVGMDVVRDRLKQVQGEIRVDTEATIGTTFTLSVPFTLSVTRVLLVESNRMLMAFPVDLIEEVMLLAPDRIMTAAGSEAFGWQGSIVQLIRLGQWLKFNCPRSLETLETPPNVNAPTVLLTRQGGQFVGIQVDRSWGEQEVAIRKIEGGLLMPTGFTHCTILGDGRVVPLVNAPELLRWIASCERSQVDARPPQPTGLALPARSMVAEPPPPALLNSERQPTILVIDDSINVRRLLALTLERAGFQVAQAKDGLDALDRLATGLEVSLVICDIEMPRLDGYGFLARFKSNPSYQQIPVTMLTSRSSDKHRKLAMSLGATAYFSKPYNEQRLLQTIQELVL